MFHILRTPCIGRRQAPTNINILFCWFIFLRNRYYYLSKHIFETIQMNAKEQRINKWIIIFYLLEIDKPWQQFRLFDWLALRISTFQFISI